MTEAPGLEAERHLREAGMMAVPTGSLVQFRVNPIQPDGTVSAEAIELFSLGEEEIGRLNEIFTDTASRLRQMELARVEVIRSTEDELVLLIPAFEEEGLAAEEDLRQSILRQLGEEDGPVFWNLMKESRGRFWGGFGRVEREVAFRLEPWEGAPESLGTAFSVSTDSEARRRWFMDEGLQLGGRKIVFGPRTTVEDRIASLGRYAYLLPLLPEDMRVTLGFQ